ncbi:MAG: TolB protein [Patescibacteria group bacterium]
MKNLKQTYFILGLLVSSCGSPKPLLVEDIRQAVPYKIAYNVLVDDEIYNYDVFTMNPDGSEKRNITKTPGVEWVYSAYEDRLYVFSDRDTCRRCFSLYETNAYGDCFTKISGDLLLDDSWIDSRKNGEEWIVKIRDKKHPTFKIIDRKGQVVEDVSLPLGYANDPVFTGDGTSIIFRGSIVGSRLKRGFQDELFEYDLESKNITQLTTYPKSDSTATLFDYHAGPPRMMKNGEISYPSKQNGNYSLFVYNSLLNKSRQMTSDTLDEIWHDWSPNNEILFFDGRQSDSLVSSHIFSMDMKTKEVIQLTDTSFLFQQGPVYVEPPKIKLN